MASAKRAVVADVAIMNSFSCSIVSTVNANGHVVDIFSLHGWEFESTHGTIATSAQLGELAKSISLRFDDTKSTSDEFDHILVHGYHLHIPPMLFANDSMKMRLKSLPISFEVDSKDSIWSWAKAHSANSLAKYPIVPIRVPFAKSWMETHNGILATPMGAEFSSRGVCSEGMPHTVVARADWDWTFSTDYCCTVTAPTAGESHVTSSSSSSYGAHDLCSDSVEGVPVPVFASNTEALVSTCYKTPASWHKEHSSGINLALLQSRDKPILFYDECLLYQDDLEDCGDVSLLARLRVMPDCWFNLIRLYVRVDGSLLRIRETRLFHEFGQQKVFMDVVWKEVHISPQGQLFGPNQVPLQDLVTAAEVANIRAVVNDVRQQRDPNRVSQVLPNCNDKFSISGYYSMNII